MKKEKENQLLKLLLNSILLITLMCFQSLVRAYLITNDYAGCRK